MTIDLKSLKTRFPNTLKKLTEGNEDLKNEFETLKTLSRHSSQENIQTSSSKTHQERLKQEKENNTRGK